MMQARHIPIDDPCPAEGRRAGLTLYEVVLAIAIFLMAMAAIGQIIRVGSQASAQAKLETDAVILAETKMGEVIAGVVKMGDVAKEPISEDDPDWFWSLAVTDAEIDGTPIFGLKELTLTVEHLGQDGQPDAVFKLRRKVRGPDLYLQAAQDELDKADAAAEAESSGSTGGTSP